MTRNHFGIEPTIDRWLNQALDESVTNGGRVQELEDRVEISMDLPGVKPEQLQVAVEHRTLTVTAMREGHGSFTQRYTIGSKYDLSAISAKLELGVLTLSLPKAAEAQPRQIPVLAA
jgi:HSP20 family protein